MITKVDLAKKVLSPINANKSTSSQKVGGLPQYSVTRYGTVTAISVDKKYATVLLDSSDNVSVKARIESNSRTSGGVTRTATQVAVGDRVTLIMVNGIYKLIGISETLREINIVSEESEAASAAVVQAATLAGDAADMAEEALKIIDAVSEGVEEVQDTAEEIIAKKLQIIRGMNATMANADSSRSDLNTIIGSDATAQAYAQHISNVETSVTQTASAIAQEVIARSNADTQLSSSITQQSTSITTLFSASRNNLLVDTDVNTVRKVRASHDRYWSDSEEYSDYIECSICKPSEMPIADMTYAYKFNANGNQASSASRRMAWYDGAPVPLIEGVPYILSCWAYSTVSGAKVSMQVGTPNSLLLPKNKTFNASTGWTRFEYRFTYSSASFGSSPRVYVGASFDSGISGIVYVCGARLVAADEFHETNTMIRETSSGILVASVGSNVGALVSAVGQFDIVALTWTNGIPTIGRELAIFSGTEVQFVNSNGVRTALFGSDGTLIGKENADHIELRPEGIVICNGPTKNALGQDIDDNILATFAGEGIVLTADGLKRATYNADGLTIYSQDGQTPMATFSDAVRIGEATGPHMDLNGGGLVLQNGSHQLISISESGFDVGDPRHRHMASSPNGIGIFDGPATNSQGDVIYSNLIASFGGTAASIGKLNGIHAVASPTAFGIVTAANNSTDGKRLIEMHYTAPNASTGTIASTSLTATQMPMHVGFFKQSQNKYSETYYDGQKIRLTTDNGTTNNVLEINQNANHSKALMFNNFAIGNIASYGTDGNIQQRRRGWWWQGLPDGRYLVVAWNEAYEIDFNAQWGATNLWMASKLESWSPPSECPGSHWRGVSINLQGGWGVLSTTSGRTINWRPLGSACYRKKLAVWIMGYMIP